MMLLCRIFARSFITFICMINFAYAAETLEISNAWSPEAPPVAKVMAGYMEIYNKSNSELSIISANSDLFEKVEIHLMEMKNGMMRMIKQDNLSVKAHDKVELKPGELHMMLIGPKKIITGGSHIPVTLVLNNKNKIHIKLMVKSEVSEEHHHHHH